MQNVRNKNHKTQQGLSGEIKALSGCGVGFERFSFSPLSLHSLVISQLWALAPFCPTFLSIIESLSANVRQNILTLPLVSFGRVFYHSNCCWETVSLAKDSFWDHPPLILDCCPTIFMSLRSTPFYTCRALSFKLFSAVFTASPDVFTSLRCSGVSMMERNLFIESWQLLCRLTIIHISVS